MKYLVSRIHCYALIAAFQLIAMSTATAQQACSSEANKKIQTEEALCAVNGLNVGCGQIRSAVMSEVSGGLAKNFPIDVVQKNLSFYVSEITRLQNTPTAGRNVCSSGAASSCPNAGWRFKIASAELDACLWGALKDRSASPSVQASQPGNTQAPSSQSQAAQQQSTQCQRELDAARAARRQQNPNERPSTMSLSDLLEGSAFNRGTLQEIDEEIARLERNLRSTNDPYLKADWAFATCAFNVKRTDLATKQQGNAPAPSSQSQAAQQQSRQAQQYAQQVNARTDQARQGKRKTHDPAAEAHQCIELDQSPGLFGGFTNSCNFKVSFYSCNYRPKTIPGGFNWSADFDCEKQKFGMYDAGAGSTVAAHNHNTETVYFFACKAPATPADIEFVAGKGATGRCFN